MYMSEGRVLLSTLTNFHKHLRVSMASCDCISAVKLTIYSFCHKACCPMALLLFKDRCTIDLNENSDATASTE